MRYKSRVSSLVERTRTRLSVLRKGVEGNKLNREDALNIINEIDSTVESIEELVGLESDDRLSNSANLI